MEHSVQRHIERLDTAVLENFLKQNDRDLNWEVKNCIKGELRKRKGSDKTNDGQRTAAE